MLKNKVIAAETHTPEYLLHKYWARKPHNIISYFIKELVPKNGVVVDPMCGSGVVLREAQKLGIVSYGFDINPIACLITDVLINPPKSDEFEKVINKLLNNVSEETLNSYSFEGKTIRYCVHSVIAKCQKCNKEIKQGEARKQGKNYICPFCGEKLRYNLENLVDTEIESIIYENDKNPCKEKTQLSIQKVESKRNVCNVNDDRSFMFAENRRILAYKGMQTKDLFTERNYSILCCLADKIEQIKDKKIKNAAKLLLSASIAQCSRLIANRNNLSTGGPAWSVPGFWVPATHLETNPLIHLRARLNKFVKGLRELEGENKQDSYVKKVDANIGLKSLRDKKIYADLIFFDPPYGDNVPYVEFSAIWNSFLKDYPKPEADISVSDRLSKKEAWEKYNVDLEKVVESINNSMKPKGKLLITFNNNDMKAWKALLCALQKNNLKCSYVLFQIPAVISSKAQMSIEGSYISDIYSIYEKTNKLQINKSLDLIANKLIECAEYRGGALSSSLAKRIMLTTWLETNTSYELLEESNKIIESIFKNNDNTLVLKNYENKRIPKFKEDVLDIAKNVLNGGPCEWNQMYESIANKVSNYGIPDAYELKQILNEHIAYSGNKCLYFINKK